MFCQYEFIQHLFLIFMKSLFVIGPSGSGKTTLCLHLANIYKKAFGEQTVTLINLDPANDHPQSADIDINELITVEDIMEQFQLGPNGSIIYSMEFLHQNIQWLLQKLRSISEKTNSHKQQKPIQQHLCIFDLPGQIQLYIHSNSLKDSITRINNEIQSSPCVLELFDCTYLQKIDHFVSLCMMSLTTMINFEMPHINLLNKIDLLKSSQSKINRGLINQYFTVPSMAQLIQQLDYTMSESCQPVNEDEKVLQMVGKVIDTYGQVSFMPCSLYKANLISNLLYQLQKVFGSINQSLQNKNFHQLVKDYDMFAHQRAITELENQLNQDEEQQLNKMYKDMQT